jgi:hypothetical protein
VTTIRFSYEGGAFQTLNEPNLAPLVVPDPGAEALIGLGLATLAQRRRAGIADSRMRSDRRTL